MVKLHSTFYWFTIIAVGLIVVLIPDYFLTIWVAAFLLILLLQLFIFSIKLRAIRFD